MYLELSNVCWVSQLLENPLQLLDHELAHLCNQLLPLGWGQAGRAKQLWGKLYIKGQINNFLWKKAVGD